MKVAISALMLGGALLAAAPAPAPAQTPTPQGAVTITRTSVERVRVDRVNLDQRIVGFTSLSSGKSDRMRLAPEVRNIEALKPGDVIVATTEERTTVILQGPGGTMPTARAVAGTVRDTQHGAHPAAEMARQSVLSYRVTAVDLAKSTISLVDTAGGEVRELAVTDPAHRARLPEVKPGDGLTLIESHLTALRLETAK